MIHNGEYLPMDKLIMKEMKDINILSTKNVLDFRKYISFKYAKSTPKEKADILADAIRKTIDERIPKVEKSLKTNLIDKIIKNSVNQGSFDINSEDIFIECLNLKCDINEDIFISALCSWINEVTVKNIEKENMKKFINSVYSLDVKAYNAESISTVLEKAHQENSDNDISNDILDNDISNDILDNDILANEISNDISDLRFNKMEFEKDDHSLAKKATAEMIMDNLKLVFKNNIKCFRLKDIAIGMLLIMLVFLPKMNTFGNNYIAGSNTNNTRNDLQSIIYDTPSQTVSGKQNQVINVMDKLNNKSKYWFMSDPNISRGFFEKTKVKSDDVEKLVMEATAYDLSIESCGKSRNHPMYGITATGTKATIRRTVAVDSSVIPLGSRLYIKFPKSYSNLDGIYIAEDTGSKVKGSIIDIFLGEDKSGESIVHKKADNFGRQRVEVSLIK